MLAAPLRSADPGLGRMMEREARALLADFDAHGNLVSRARAALYRRLSAGEPSIEGVAADLGLAPRTLQDRLRRQGQPYQEVLDGLRRSLADIYLRDPALSLTEIALLLGFSESSAFSRAFRRWRGCPRWRGAAAGARRKAHQGVAQHAHLHRFGNMGVHARGQAALPMLAQNVGGERHDRHRARPWRRSCSRIRRVASKPSISGISQSIRIRS
ncbi:HTH-type transcriptional regulator VirS [Alcanivorax sp. ALC70]|nr:HTH-type transcriptional regulator VirS [Alcanivorax sp. ALC70]